MTEPAIDIVTADHFKFFSTGEFIKETENTVLTSTFYVIKNIDLTKEIFDARRLIANAAQAHPADALFDPVILYLPDNPTLREVRHNNRTGGVYISVSGDFTLDHEIKGISGIIGDTGPNTITVKGRQDVALFGGADKDILIGGDGENTFFSSKGDDTFVGGSGDNIYVFKGEYDNATIQHQGGNNALYFFGQPQLNDFKPIKEGDNLIITFHKDEQSHRVNIFNFFTASDKFLFGGSTKKYALKSLENGIYKFELASK